METIQSLAREYAAEISVNENIIADLGAKFEEGKEVKLTASLAQYLAQFSIGREFFFFKK
jgi:hypothetical protein